MIFLKSSNTYVLYNSDLSYFVTKTHLNREIQNISQVYTFLNDMKYKLNYKHTKPIEII